MKQFIEENIEDGIVTKMMFSEKMKEMSDDDLFSHLLEIIGESIFADLKCRVLEKLIPLIKSGKVSGLNDMVSRASISIIPPNVMEEFGDGKRREGKEEK